MTRATKAPTRERLLPVGLFPNAARAYGITETAPTLILTGRRAFYRWSEIAAAMPEWARDYPEDSDEELRRWWSV